MENAKNQKSHVGTILIVVVVLVCAVLILADLSGNVINEIRTSRQPSVETTPLPRNSMPTLPAAGTSTPFVIEG